MTSNLKQILAQAPIDMSDLLHMADKTPSSGKSLLLAGCSNAGVLTLLKGFGLGDALDCVQKPCVIELVHGDQLSIHLHCDGTELCCTSMEDLAERLRWTQDSRAFVQLACPAGLPDWDRLIFAVLDGMQFRDQLNQHALGCDGAVIILDAIDAPAAEVYHLAAWLHEACDLQEAAVLLCGAAREPNAAPATVLAMSMGRESLPVITCSMEIDRILPALESAVSLLSRSAEHTAGLEREVARCALIRLAGEKQRLMASSHVPKKARLSLAERFSAQVPGARNKVKTLLSAELANRLNTDVREFSIFLQHHIEELLLSSLPQLENPKAALRAFAHGYLSDVMNRYCHALLYDMVSIDVAPGLRNLYLKLFDDAWISCPEDPESLPQSIREEYQIAMEQMKLAGQDLLDRAVSFAVKAVLRSAAKPLSFLSGLLVKAIREPVHNVHFALTSTESYARQKAVQMQKTLNEASASYQALIQEEMFPQLQEELLHWFDEQVRQATKRLQEEDDRLTAEYEQQMQHDHQRNELLEAITATEAALAPFASATRHQ